MRKSILWLSHFVPYPPIGGAFQRSFNLLKEIGRTNDIYLFAVQHKAATHPDSKIDIAEAKLQELCAGVKIVKLPSIDSRFRFVLQSLGSLRGKQSLTLHLYDHKSIHQDLQIFMQNQNFDLVHFDAISMCVFYQDASHIPVKVLNHHGAEGWMIKRRIKKEGNLLKKLFFFAEGFKLVGDETRFCPKFDINTVCSDFDAKLLKQQATDAVFMPIENGVDASFFFRQVGVHHTPEILFAGRLDQYSNREGIRWFCRDIWPRIQSKKPEIRLTIVGNNPPDDLLALAHNDTQVEVTGFVDDVRPYFDRATLVIAPLRDGGGTRIKILDAWSMGLPVVCTTIAGEGLAVQPESNLLIADDESSYIKQVLRIIEDKSLASRLAEEGRKTVENRYSWRIIGRHLDNLYNELVDKQSGNMTIDAV